MHYKKIAPRREVFSMSPVTKPIIVWFRQDLRIQDNLCLYYACSTGKPLGGLKKTF